MPIVSRALAIVYRLLLAVFCLLSTVFCPPASAAPVFTSSASGRFVVIGADTLQNAGIIRWAEETAEQWEGVLGRPFPSSRAKPVEILLVDSHRVGSPAVTIDPPSAGDEVSPRRLTFSRKSPVDIDLRREGLIRLALQRTVAAGRFEAGLPAVDPQLPLWLVVGLAGNLDKTLAARNHSIWTATSMEEGDVAVGEVLAWTRLPEGWYGRRAACGLFMTWILSCPGSLDRILDRLITQEPLSVEWLAEKGIGTRTVARLESRWKAWNERQDRAIREFGGLSPALITQLREVAQPVDSSMAPRLRFSLAQEKIQGIRALTLGKAPELVEVGEQYCRYYEGVLRGAWAITQRRRLSRAVAALDHLETLTRAREAWVDEVERRQGGGVQGSGFGVQGSGGRGKGSGFGVQELGGGTGLDKSRMEAYVDEVERGNCQVKGEE